MMRHLLWKDAMTARALLLAVLIGILGAAVCLVLVSPLMNEADAASVFVSFWILMPNLFAIGVPAILVGNEEERGTLLWLRTLPVRWQSIADAKLLVALGGLVICWLGSSLVLISGGMLVTDKFSPFAEEMISLEGVLYLACFSVMLMLLGFVTAYLFRSPVAGLLAVVPLIGGVTYLFELLTRWILTGQINYGGALTDPTFSEQLALGVATLGGMIFVAALQRMLARRRLNRMVGRSWSKRLNSSSTGVAYKPPVAVIAPRASTAKVLVWQQIRQCWHLGLVILLTSVSYMLLSYGFRRDRWNSSATAWESLIPLFLGLAAIWLGVLVFYGDNFKNRRSYFADRGFTVNVIWWTRLSAPFFMLVALIVFLLVLHPDTDTLLRVDLHSTGLSLAGAIIELVTCFAFGQLVCQWIRRPVLAFFAGPAFAVIPAIILMLFASMYPNYAWWIMISALVMLFGSWQLTGAWIENPHRDGNNAGGIRRCIQWLKKPEVRAVSYVLLAILCPLVIVASLRVSTTPVLRAQWRQRLLAAPVPEPKTYPNGRPIYRNLHAEKYSTYAFADKSERSADQFGADERNECLKLLREELASDEIGSRVSREDIQWLLELNTPTLTGAENLDSDLRLLATEVLLDWSNRVRQQVCEGGMSCMDLMFAERCEYDASIALLDMYDQKGMTRPLARVISQIPSAELRQESRRIALQGEWQVYNRQSWWVGEGKSKQAAPKNFLGFPVALMRSAIPYERQRADRNVDEITYLLLKLCEQPSDADHLQFQEQALVVWRDLLGPRHKVDSLPLSPYWISTQAHAERIDRLRVAAQKLMKSSEVKENEDREQQQDSRESE